MVVRRSVMQSMYSALYGRATHPYDALCVYCMHMIKNEEEEEEAE